MRDVCCSSRISQGSSESHKSEYPHQVLEPDGEWEREHKNFLIAKQQSGGHKNCIDSAGGANGCSLRHQMNDGSECVSQSNGAEACTNHAEKEELKETTAAPGNFKHGAKHPQHEHVEEQVKKASVKEPVRQELINMAMDDVMRTERQRTENNIGEMPLADCEEYQPKKVNTRVNRD